MTSQQVTPELLDWIGAQARAGHSQEAVLAAMRAGGWFEHAARLAIEPPLSSAEQPRIVVFRGLLAHEECDALVELTRAWLQRSVTVDTWSGGDEINNSRTSEGMCFERGGQRVATLLLYLAAPVQGGATILPESGFAVMPVKGSAVFFSYDRPHPVTLTLHGGAPVIAGEKWVATKWLRAGV